MWPVDPQHIQTTSENFTVVCLHLHEPDVMKVSLDDRKGSWVKKKKKVHLFDSQNTKGSVWAFGERVENLYFIVY